MKNLLIIGFVWPEPNSTAAGTRMIQLIEFFQKQDYKISFLSTASKNSNSFNLSNLGITEIPIKLNDSSFDELLKAVNPSIVLFDRYLTEEQFGWRVEENCPDALRILDTEDLHFLRKARQLALKNGSVSYNSFLKNDITIREIASIYRSDLTLIISSFEINLLVETFKIDVSILIYIPFMVEEIDSNLFKNYPDFNERSNFMTIGNFKHEPNYNAVLHLKNTIWPLIRKELPQANLYVYGAYATEKVTQLNNTKDGFIIKGWIENVQDAFINSRICLAPIQFGAGLKGKLLNAMQFGTPSITTSIGAEGMHNNFHWNGFIEDDPANFVEKSIKLYSNEKLWNIAQDNGKNIINNCYSSEHYSSKLLTKISDIQRNFLKHRQQNYIGLMLSHHLHRSTKYLSKWIEEKNRI